MSKIRPCLSLLPALALAACGQQSPRHADVADAAVPDAGRPAPPPQPTASPDFAPPVLTADAERSVKGARNVLLSFGRAIELGQFGHAWGLLSRADQAKWTRSAFAGLFADLDDIVVAMPDGTMEGAAGSSFYTAPLAVTGKDRQGRPVRLEGKAVLRRVNDVDGATPEQLRWHLETVTLDWTH